jgi:hypothetical protein
VNGLQHGDFSTAPLPRNELDKDGKTRRTGGRSLIKANAAPQTAQPPAQVFCPEIAGFFSLAAR